MPVDTYFHLDWKTVKQIDKEHLEASLGPVDLTHFRQFQRLFINPPSHNQ
jgi:hypothetical protein